MSYCDRYAKGLLLILSPEEQNSWKAALHPLVFPQHNTILSIIEQKTLPYLESFLSLVFYNDRVDDLRQIFLSIQKLLFKDKKVVKIVTARTLSDSEKQDLIKTLDIKDAIYFFTQNPDLLGGILIECNNKCIDATIQQQLRKIEMSKR